MIDAPLDAVRQQTHRAIEEIMHMDIDLAIVFTSALVIVASLAFRIVGRLLGARSLSRYDRVTRVG